MNKESLLAVYISKGANRKVNSYSFPIIKKERWLKGAKTKYDIPQYIEGIPEGFAIFCTTKEAGKVRKYQEQIEKKNKNKSKIKNELENKKQNEKEINEDLNRDVEDMDVVNKRLIAGAMKMEENGINNKNDINDKDKDDDDNNKDMILSDELEEPIPRNEHKYCHICKTKFEKYLKHIKCYSHFENLQRHQTFFNRIRKSFERIINFWDIKNGRIKKKNNTEINEKSTKFISPIKSEEISTKEGSHQDKNIINNLINLLNNGNNNENINNNSNNNIKKNNSEIIIKNNIVNNTNKKPLTNSNIDLNKPPKNTQNLFNTCYNNKKEDKSNNNKIFTPFTPFINQNSIKKKCNSEHIFNLTYNNINNNNSINNNNINNNLFKNENKNSIKTVNYISINKKDEENLTKKIPDKNNIINNKDEKVPLQPKKKFVIKCFPKFSTLQTFQLTKPKKRKKNDFYKGGDIFVISTPKKIDFDYFPVLSVDNPKKLINKNIVFFQ